MSWTARYEIAHDAPAEEWERLFRWVEAELAKPAPEPMVWPEPKRRWPWERSKT